MGEMAGTAGFSSVKQMSRIDTVVKRSIVSETGCLGTSSRNGRYTADSREFSAACGSRSGSRRRVGVTSRSNVEEDQPKLFTPHASVAGFLIFPKANLAGGPENGILPRCWSWRLTPPALPRWRGESSSTERLRRVCRRATRTASRLTTPARSGERWTRPRRGCRELADRHIHGRCSRDGRDARRGWRVHRHHVSIAGLHASLRLARGGRGQTCERRPESAGRRGLPSRAREREDEWTGGRVDAQRADAWVRGRMAVMVMAVAGRAADGAHEPVRSAVAPLQPEPAPALRAVSTAKMCPPPSLGHTPASGRTPLALPRRALPKAKRSTLGQNADPRYCAHTPRLIIIHAVPATRVSLPTLDAGVPPCFFRRNERRGGRKHDGRWSSFLQDNGKLFARPARPVVHLIYSSSDFSSLPQTPQLLCTLASI